MAEHERQLFTLGRWEFKSSAATPWGAALSRA